MSKRIASLSPSQMLPPKSFTEAIRLKSAPKSRQTKARTDTILEATELREDISSMDLTPMESVSRFMSQRDSSPALRPMSKLSARSISATPSHTERDFSMIKTDRTSRVPSKNRFDSTSKLLIQPILDTVNEDSSQALERKHL